MPLESERFIKSYSSLIESPIWPDDGLFKLYHYCLYKASRNVYLWRGIQIQPGEFPMSYRHAAAEPVSYTHLAYPGLLAQINRGTELFRIMLTREQRDLFRQTLRFLRRNDDRRADGIHEHAQLCRVQPVSYTHLVRLRQDDAAALHRRL